MNPIATRLPPAVPISTRFLPVPSPLSRATERHEDRALGRVAPAFRHVDPNSIASACRGHRGETATRVATAEVDPSATNGNSTLPRIPPLAGWQFDHPKCGCASRSSFSGHPGLRCPCAENVVGGSASHARHRPSETTRFPLVRHGRASPLRKILSKTPRRSR